MIKIIVRLIVLVIFFAALLLASNKHRCVAMVYDVREAAEDKEAFAIRINFWWILGGVAAFSVLLWLGGFFG